MAAGHQIAELNPAQAILIGALANSGFDIEAVTPRVPSQERRLVAAAGQLAERFVALGLVHPDSLQNDGDSTFLLYTGMSDLLSSRAVATVLDDEAEGRLASYLTSSTVELNDLPHSVAARALSFAPLYVLRSVPFLADLKAEAILAWKEELADSLGEYRQECASAALGAEDITLAETSQYLREVGQHLDGLYVGCLRSMRASPTWKVSCSDQASGFISPLAAGGLSLQLTGDSAIAAATLGAGSLANALVIIAEGMRTVRTRRSHPLYWRYRLSAALDSKGSSTARTWVLTRHVSSAADVPSRKEIPGRCARHGRPPAPRRVAARFNAATCANSLGECCCCGL